MNESVLKPTKDTNNQWRTEGSHRRILALIAVCIFAGYVGGNLGDAVPVLDTWPSIVRDAGVILAVLLIGDGIVQFFHALALRRERNRSVSRYHQMSNSLRKNLKEEIENIDKQAASLNAEEIVKRALHKGAEDTA